MQQQAKVCPNLAVLGRVVCADELHQARVVPAAERPDVVHHLVPPLVQQQHSSEACMPVTLPCL